MLSVVVQNWWYSQYIGNWRDEGKTFLKRNEMGKDQLKKKIIWIEITGFISIIFIVWLDEFFDLPHALFGAMATPPNYPESIFETVLILLLAFVIIPSTHSILKRLKILEGILPICSFCKMIQSESGWIPLEHYISLHSKADFSHSLCPECAEENYGDILGDKQNKY
jgi:hypothetical protein